VPVPMGRVTRSAALAAVAALLSGGTPAHAAHGNGLYQPFPKGAAQERARRYISHLPTRPAGRTRFSDAELARGVVVSPRAVGLPEQAALPAAAKRIATRRAGDGSGSGLPLSAQLLLVVAALGVGVALATAARRHAAGA
jgi:hypothetical protein